MAYSGRVDRRRSPRSGWFKPSLGSFVDREPIATPSRVVHTSAFVGCVVGWIFDLGSRMKEITRESIEKMTELSQILEFQQQPLRLLANARVHAPTVGILLKESIGEQYKTIASVDPNKYLSFLKQALNNSGRFNAVMRNRVAWFRDSVDGESYLQDIARRRMREKVRIFIINDDTVQAMREDLADAPLMEFYWQKTGAVDTYWITESDLKMNYPDLRMPDDFESSPSFSCNCRTGVSVPSSRRVGYARLCEMCASLTA